MIFFVLIVHFVFVVVWFKAARALTTDEDERT